MPPLPSQPEIFYSTPDMTDFYQQMGRFARQEVVLMVNSVAPTWNETTHLFVPHDVDPTIATTVAITDRVFPVPTAALMHIYLETDEYDRTWGRKDGLPDVIDGGIE